MSALRASSGSPVTKTVCGCGDPLDWRSSIPPPVCGREHRQESVWLMGPSPHRIRAAERRRKGNRWSALGEPRNI